MSCVHVAEVHVPGVSEHESLPHWPSLVHLHLPPLHVPPALHVLVQESGVQEPATTVPLQVYPAEQSESEAQGSEQSPMVGAVPLVQLAVKPQSSAE